MTSRLLGFFVMTALVFRGQSAIVGCVDCPDGFLSVDACTVTGESDSCTEITACKLPSLLLLPAPPILVFVSASEPYLLKILMLELTQS